MGFPCLLNIAFHYFLLPCFWRFCGFVGTVVYKAVVGSMVGEGMSGKEYPFRIPSPSFNSKTNFLYTRSRNFSGIKRYFL